MGARIRKHDTVMVVAGRERGKSGKVLSVQPSKGRVVVEKLNMVKRHTRPGGTAGKQGGIIEKEGTISLSNVRLLCPKCNAPTRVGVRSLDDEGKVRCCKRCNEQIDK